MQRKIWSILAFLLMLLGLCGWNSYTGEVWQNQQTIEEERVPLAAAIVGSPVIETKAEQNKETVDTSFYAYQKLTKQEKLLYNEILDILRQQTAEGKVSTRSPETLKKVFQCVMDDHPELFYVSGYQYMAYSLIGKVTRIIIQPVYTMEAEEIASVQKKIDAYVKTCFKNMEKQAGDYAKVRYLYEYVITNTEYENDAENSQNISSVFLNHASVCQGYAKALQYLCQKAGLETALVNGSIQDVGHAWNLIKLEGDWYYVDATLGDASYVSANDEKQVDHVPPISYDYLCVTSEVIKKTHQIENEVPVPECTATKCNYYVQEKLLFKEYDEEQAREIFTEAWQEGEQYLTIQCASQEVFETVRTHLIDEQMVFRFVGNQAAAIGYAQNENLLTLSFWTL